MNRFSRFYLFIFGVSFFAGVYSQEPIGSNCPATQFNPDASRYAVGDIFLGFECFGDPIYLGALATGECVSLPGLPPQFMECNADGLGYTIRFYPNETACEADINRTNSDLLFVPPMNYIENNCLEFPTFNSVSQFSLLARHCGNCYPPVPLDDSPFPSMDEAEVVLESHYRTNTCEEAPNNQNDPNALLWFVNEACTPNLGNGNGTRLTCNPGASQPLIERFDNPRCDPNSLRFEEPNTCFLEDDNSGRFDYVCGNNPENTILSDGEIAGIAIAGVIFVCCAILATALIVFFVAPKKKQTELFESDIYSTIPERDIKIGSLIGKGNFGVVYKGSYQETTVALKSVVNGDNHEIENEWKILKKLSHPHVIRFYGVYYNFTEALYFLVTEFMEKGNLLANLRKKNDFSTQDLTRFAMEIACGMSYIHSQNIVHRDLACRNVLLDKENKVKVSDFGLSRAMVEEIYATKTKQIPVRWTAPEALSKGEFSRATDVWSYGVTLWEIFSEGDLPYGSAYTNQQLIDAIKKKKAKLSAPDATPPQVATLLKICVSFSPELRPTFDDIVKDLGTSNYATASDLPESQTGNEEVYQFTPSSKGTSEHKSKGTNHAYHHELKKVDQPYDESTSLESSH